MIRNRLRSAAPQGAEQVQEGSLLDQIVSEGRLARDAEAVEYEAGTW